MLTTLDYTKGMKRQDPVFDRRSVARGQILLKDGDEGTIAYLIQSGELLVYAEKDGVEVELARLGPGQIVGEMALIFDGARTANIKALKDTNLIVITRPQFEDKLHESDPMIRAIVQMLSKRIVNANNTLLNRCNEIQDLAETSRIIYQNIYEKVPMGQKYTLQSTVLPHLQALMEAIESFNDRYADDTDRGST